MKCASPFHVSVSVSGVETECQHLSFLLDRRHHVHTRVSKRLSLRMFHTTKLFAGEGGARAIDNSSFTLSIPPYNGVYMSDGCVRSE